MSQGWGNMPMARPGKLSVPTLNIMPTIIMIRCRYWRPCSSVKYVIRTANGPLILGVWDVHQSTSYIEHIWAYLVSWNLREAAQILKDHELHYVLAKSAAQHTNRICQISIDQQLLPSLRIGHIAPQNGGRYHARIGDRI